MQIALPDTNQNLRESNALDKGHKRLREFIAKFSHDWTMFSAAGLAYSLMVAVVPIGIAIVAVLGFTVGNLSPAALSQLLERINHAFPSTIASQNVLEPALTRLHNSAGLLAVLAVVVAIFGGSRLFVAIERCFDIIYRTYPRRAIPQYIMALLMMLVFIALTPVMVLASAAPALLLSLLQSSTLSHIPLVSQLARDGFLLSAASVFGGLLVSWMLFQATYLAVPNQRIRLRNSWKGALVAAVLLELFLAIFPFYVTHFMRSYTGVAGFAVIFLLFFYYFAVILLLGAQVNAYFCEHVGPLPDALAVVLQNTIGQHPAGTIDAVLEQAATQPISDSTRQATASTNTSVQPSSSASADRMSRSRQTITGTPPVPSAQPTTTSQETAEASTSEPLEATDEARPGLLSFLHKQRQSGPHAASTIREKHRRQGALLPTVVGTALAFGLTFARLRRKLPGEEQARVIPARQRKKAA
jgi:YihY family inner membrane protein